MKPSVRVITNNDIAYLLWTVPKKIAGCLGFSIHRQPKGKPAEPLPAWVGFERVNKPPKKPRDTDVWPIQSFQWKDVLAPRKGSFRYLIYTVGGTPKKPVRSEKPIITTKWVGLDEQLGPVRVVFNRGLLSTQAMNRGSNAPAKNAEKLRTMISTPNHAIRARLAKELLPTIRELLLRAQASGGVCYGALYELTDEELIATIEATANTELILSNANSSKQVDGKTKTVYDGTNEKARARLRKSVALDLTDRLLKGNSIGHNKFVLFEDADRKLRTVLTSSSNWTATGLCGQTNNAVLVDDEDLAAHYFTYWRKLRNEQTDLQTKELRKWTRENPFELAIGNGGGKMKVWFSPNTRTKTRSKTKPETPVDMAEVFELIEKAKKVVLFLLFNPGKPSIVDVVKEVADERQKAGKALFVRGAISDAATAREGSVRIFDRSAKKPADRVITGVAGVPDDFGYWERELLKLGHAAIHDKVLVVDPFSKDCAVVTGSHNLGFKASFANDENMVIIRGNRRVAEAYAAHVLDVVNHYKWRYKLQELWEDDRLDDAWRDLDDDDGWQNKYFDKGFLASRDKALLF